MADDMTADVSQVETFAKDVESSTRRLGAASADAVREAAKTTQRSARANVARRSGATARSITTTYEGDGRSSEMGATVGTPYFTARFLEDGTAFQQPQPFMAPAFEAGQQEFEKRIDSATDKVI